MIRILIIDDEPPARARLRRMLENVPGCEVAGEAGTGNRALEMIRELEPDLLLLDISMPGMDGMTLARTLQSMERPPEIVFCTAWPDQALKAFDCNAADYLVKPVRPQRLQAAMDKVSRLLRQGPETAAAGQYLRSTVGGKTRLVSLADVICLVAEDKYTTLIHADGKTVINDSLVVLEKRYAELFMRVHRNALVAPGAVRGLEKGASGASYIVLEGTDFRPEVSRRKLAEIRKYLREFG